MHFTNFVVHAGVKQNTLGRGGFACVNVRRNTNVAVALNGGMASHNWVFLNVKAGCKQRHTEQAVRACEALV